MTSVHYWILSCRLRPTTSDPSLFVPLLPVFPSGYCPYLSTIVHLVGEPLTTPESKMFASYMLKMMLPTYLAQGRPEKLFDQALATAPRALTAWCASCVKGGRSLLSGQAHTIFANEAYYTETEKKNLVLEEIRRTWDESYTSVAACQAFGILPAFSVEKKSTWILSCGRWSFSELSSTEAFLLWPQELVAAKLPKQSQQGFINVRRFSIKQSELWFAPITCVSFDHLSCPISLVGSWEASGPATIWLASTATTRNHICFFWSSANINHLVNFIRLRG